MRGPGCLERLRLIDGGPGQQTSIWLTQETSENSQAKEAARMEGKRDKTGPNHIDTN